MANVNSEKVVDSQDEVSLDSSPTPSKSQVPPPANRFVSFMRKIYHPLGFKKGYNFTLFFIFGGAMLGFVLARFEYWNFDGTYKNNAMPGDWYWYHSGHYRVGMLLHLATCLPAGFLAVFQFVPIIRHKFLLYHRIAGYIIILLVFITNAGTLMIARRAGGGDLSSQALIDILAIMTCGGISLAFYNIKKKQIDQHRAWMLRTWFYMGTIITLRLILIISTNIISLVGTYYYVVSCDQIQFTLGGSREAVRHFYPMCLEANGTDQGYVAAHANFTSDDPVSIGSSLFLSFGMAGTVALALHAIGVEIYLHLTPREAQRLRQISYEKQLEAGYKNPGSAGLVVERFGDADPYVPMKSLPA